MVYYNNGINEKRFNSISEVPDGWKSGRLVSPVTTSDKIWITDGVQESFLDKELPSPR